MKIKIMFLLHFFFVTFACLQCKSGGEYQDKTNNPVNKINMSVHKIVQQNIIDRNFLTWNGFPDTCTFEDIIASLLDDWDLVPERYLGSNFRRAHMLLLLLDGYYRPSLSFENDIPILFEAMNPELHIEDSLLQKFIRKT